jgi:Fe-S oxidoreductase
MIHLPWTGRVFDELRRGLSSILGLELVEAENFNRQLSVCCSVGG